MDLSTKQFKFIFGVCNIMSFSCTHQKSGRFDYPPIMRFGFQAAEIDILASTGKFPFGQNNSSLHNCLGGTEKSCCFENVQLPFKEPYFIENLYLCFNGRSDQPITLELSFTTETGAKITKSGYISRKNSGDNWYRLDNFALTEKVIECEIIVTSMATNCQVHGIIFGLTTADSARKTSEWESKVINGTFVQASQYNSPPHAYTASSVSQPDSIYRGSFYGSYNQSNAQEALTGDGSVDFYRMQIHFVSPRYIQHMYINVYGNDQIKDVEAIFYSSTGVRTSKCLRVNTTNSGQYQWHSFPVDVESVIACELITKTSYNGNPYASVQGLYFLADASKDSTCSSLLSTRVAEGGIKSLLIRESEYIDLSLALEKSYSKFSSVQGVYAPGQDLGDISKMLPFLQSGLCFHSLEFEFHSPFSLSSIHICCKITNYQPKYLDIIFTLDDGSSRIHKYEVVPKRNYKYEWHSLPVEIDQVVKCVISPCQSHWSLLYGLQFEDGGPLKSELPFYRTLSLYKNWKHQYFNPDELCEFEIGDIEVFPAEKEDLTLDMLQGKGIAEFKSLTIPFSTPCDIVEVFIRIDRVKRIGFKFFTSDNEFEMICQNRNEIRGYYWFSIEVGIEKVLSCEISCLDEDGTLLYPAGICFLKHSDLIHGIRHSKSGFSPSDFQIQKHLDFIKDMNTLPCEITKIRGKYLGFQPKSRIQKVLNDSGRVQFQSILLPFVFPHTVNGVYLCVHGNNSPRVLVLKLWSSSSEEPEIRYLKFSLPEEKMIEWHYFPMFFKDLSRCEICHESSWDGRDFSTLFGIKFIMDKYAASILQESKTLSLLQALSEQVDMRIKTMKKKFDDEIAIKLKEHQDIIDQQQQYISEMDSKHSRYRDELLHEIHCVSARQSGKGVKIDVSVNNEYKQTKQNRDRIFSGLSEFIDIEKIQNGISLLSSFPRSLWLEPSKQFFLFNVLSFFCNVLDLPTELEQTFSLEESSYPGIASIHHRIRAITCGLSSSPKQICADCSKDLPSKNPVLTDLETRIQQLDHECVRASSHVTNEFVNDLIESCHKSIEYGRGLIVHAILDDDESQGYEHLSDHVRGSVELFNRMVSLLDKNVQTFKEDCASFALDMSELGTKNWSKNYAEKDILGLLKQLQAISKLTMLDDEKYDRKEEKDEESEEVIAIDRDQREFDVTLPSLPQNALSSILLMYPTEIDSDVAHSSSSSSSSSPSSSTYDGLASPKSIRDQISSILSSIQIQVSSFSVTQLKTKHAECIQNLQHARAALFKVCCDHTKKCIEQSKQSEAKLKELKARQEGTVSMSIDQSKSILDVKEETLEQFKTEQENITILNNILSLQCQYICSRDDLEDCVVDIVSSIAGLIGLCSEYLSFILPYRHAIRCCLLRVSELNSWIESVTEVEQSEAEMTKLDKKRKKLKGKMERLMDKEKVCKGDIRSYKEQLQKVQYEDDEEEEEDSESGDTDSISQKLEAQEAKLREIQEKISKYRDELNECSSRCMALQRYASILASAGFSVPPRLDMSQVGSSSELPLIFSTSTVLGMFSNVEEIRPEGSSSYGFRNEGKVFKANWTHVKGNTGGRMIKEDIPVFLKFFDIPSETSEWASSSAYKQLLPLIFSTSTVLGMFSNVEEIRPEGSSSYGFRNEGKVFKANWTHVKGNTGGRMIKEDIPVFLKFFDIPSETSEWASSSAYKQLVRSAVTARCRGDCRFIIPLLSVFHDRHIYKSSVSGAYLVFPLMEHGDLYQWIRKFSPSLSELKHVMKCILHALIHLHKRGIVHCDLKPQNVLIDSKGNGVLSDFEGAVDASQRASRLLSQTMLVGTQGYIAPEITAAVHNSKSPHPEPSSDMFSFGVLLKDVFVRWMEKKKASSIVIPDEVEGIIMHCTKENPSERPSAADILSHSWFM
ncbi:hypothetical protein ADUPG1_008901 [Aduncisulcus paluster]|uniref:Protein kinase domain-containing protein n=1 Tax=Aduncisulcus paluster TaxID=2918883 RepID=A0ABQ5KTL8_9EUKA|nr:hypothetical protein ADUPG1_008901 [Aduncisulcus paluster]